MTMLLKRLHCEPSFSLGGWVILWDVLCNMILSNFKDKHPFLNAFCLATMSSVPKVSTPMEHENNVLFLLIFNHGWPSNYECWIFFQKCLQTGLWLDTGSLDYSVVVRYSLVGGCWSMGSNRGLAKNLTHWKTNSLTFPAIMPTECTGEKSFTVRTNIID